MKTIRLVYIIWRGINMRCTLTQIESIPQSDIDVNIQSVTWSETGIEFCGYIVHEQLPDVIQTTIPSNKTTLSYINMPLNHRKFYFGHKHVMREEWEDLLLDIVNETANSHIQQIEIEF